MALLTTKDNVCEVSSTKGVASFILGGAIKGSQSFATAYPSGGSVYYFAREFTLTKEVGIMWEIGTGTLTGGTLSRDTVISSSAGTSKVQFPGPVTQIYSIVPLSTLVTDINAALASYNTPVAWNGSTDRVLGVGQITQDSFTSATSMPLHIACGDGQIYEIEIVGSYTPAAATGNPILKPNNSTPVTNSFTTQYGVQTQTTIIGNFSVAGADNGFLLSAGQASLLSAQATIFTSTATKCTSTHFSSYNTVPNYASGWMDSTWNDTTTVWSSLGTILMAPAWTGQIVVRRVA